MSNSLQPHGLYSPRNSPGWNTGLVSLSLLQAIFPIQGLNPGLPHCRWVLYQLSHKGSPRIQILEWVAYSLCSRSSQPRNGTGGGKPVSSRISCQIFLKKKKIFSWCGPLKKSLLNTLFPLFYILAFQDLSFTIGDRTCTPCIGRQSLNHCTTREVPANISKAGYFSRRYCL